MTTISLSTNPFHLLSTTTRDNRQRLLELVKEKSIEHDPKLINDAYQILTNPKKRLQAEIAWFPGVSVKNTQRILQSVKEERFDPYFISTLPYLAKCNAILASLSIIKKTSETELVKWLYKMVIDFDKIDIKSLKTVINEDRSIAGFTQIEDEASIGEALAEYKEIGANEITSLLDTIPDEKLTQILQDLVERAVSEEIEVSILDRLIDTYYSMKIHTKMVKQEKIIERLSLKINAISGATKTISADTVREFIEILDENNPVECGVKKALLLSPLSLLLDEYTAQLKCFYTLVNPIKMCLGWRGIEHTTSQNIAEEAREIAYELAFTTKEVYLAENLYNKIQEYFSEIESVIKDVVSDLHQIQKQKDDKRTLLKEQSMISQGQHTIEFSPAHIKIDHQHYRLNDINSIDFKMNEVENYSQIIFGITGRADLSITWLTTAQAKIVIDKLWSAVGVRLLLAMIKSLVNDKCIYRTICDKSVLLQNENTSDEKHFLWSQIEFVAFNPDFIFIRATNDHDFRKDLNSIDHRNILILHKLLTIFLEKGKESIIETFGM